MQTRCTPTRHLGPEVLGVDGRAERRGRISQALAPMGLQVQWLTPAGRAGPDAAQQMSMLVLCADRSAAEALRRATGSGEPVAGRLAPEGCRVLAYADGSAGWSIGDRCHVAVLGARVLLDPSDAAFESRLAEVLVRWHGELDALRDEQEEETALMASLGIVGSSPALRGTVRQLRRAAQLSDVPILLTGESGSGKELLAQAVHALDPLRRSARMVAVNCAAITPSLAEAELFGHTRGAFTGAQHDKRGLLRAAHRGTLFLDEVGELGADLQGKLLRVIQEQRVMPVGSDEELPIDVRVIAATHRDLAALVREGRFREDLYYRLCVVPIAVPALRERRSDIPLLVAHLLRRQAQRSGRRVPAFTSAFADALSQYPLPGNVRELDNILRQAIVAAGAEPELDLAHLPAAVLSSLQGAPASCSAPAARSSAGALPAGPTGRTLLQVFDHEGWRLERCLDSCERTLVEAALARSRGNQTAAARLLGVTPRCVYSKLRKHLLA